jgi:hypothetical protein
MKIPESDHLTGTGELPFSSSAPRGPKSHGLHPLDALREGYEVRREISQRPELARAESIGCAVFWSGESPGSGEACSPGWRRASWWPASGPELPAADRPGGPRRMVSGDSGERDKRRTRWQAGSNVAAACYIPGSAPTSWPSSWPNWFSTSAQPEPRASVIAACNASAALAT